MPSRWEGGGATVGVLALTIVLVALDVGDAGVRRFWATHALTTDTVAGVLVLALTVLVVNQVLNRRNVKERSRVVAAQAGALIAQARRAVKATVALRDEDGEHQSAAEELRTYLLMLLVSAPVLIDDPVARLFLERAQALAAEIARVVSPAEMSAIMGSVSAGALDAAVERLRDAATPLIAVLRADERFAVTELSNSG